MRSPSNSKSNVCLVTGGAGFIGSHLVEGLLKAGYPVIVLDNLSTGSLHNLAPLLENPSYPLQFIQGDICHLESVQKATTGVNTIFHHAALASVNRSMADPVGTHDINVTGTLNVLEAARQNGVSLVTIASTAAIYGSAPVLPKYEKLSPDPVSPYGLTKLMGEQYAELYSRLYGLNITCFRYFNVFGPRQNPKSQYTGVITTFVNTILQGEQPIIYGDGHQSRDFISVYDIVQANIRAVEQKPTGFHLMNVGSGQSRSILDVLEWLRTCTSQDFIIDYRPERRGDLRHSTADITQIREILGFEVQTPFYDGLRDFVQYVESQYPLQPHAIKLQNLANKK